MREEVSKYEHLIANELDDSKNGSIMIAQDQHRERNRIMRKIRLEQMKKRNLPNFRRKTREELIKKRKARSAPAAVARLGSPIPWRSRRACWPRSSPRPERDR